ncbi:MAG: biotin--[acetyl-CoA-carboxylase] ligase [Thermoleophilia bacterium]
MERIDCGRVDGLIAEALARELIDLGTAQRTRIVSRLLSGERLSGEGLAQILSVSRAAVHKHIEHLRDEGVAIRSAPGTGYELVAPPDSLEPEFVLPSWLSRAPDNLRPAEPPLGLPALPYLYLARAESTNELVRLAANRDAPPGLLAVTDDQCAGRGRLGRVWVSEPGRDLTFSLLIRPDLGPAMLRHLLFAVAVAVAEVLDRLPGLGGRVGVKWPNDVLVDGEKVCGILVETSLNMDTVYWMIIGVGINVNSRPRAHMGDDWSVGGFPPVSVREATGSTIVRPDLMVDVLERMTVRLEQVLAGGTAEVLARYRSLDSLLGRRVTVTSGAGVHARVIQGHADGIGPDGGLFVRRDDGVREQIDFGEAGLSVVP